MAVNRKYSALPDLDDAPDIYETPDLTDDNSTILTTTLPSQSDHDDDEEDDDNAAISRSRLQVDQARSRFLPAQVDARDVDFSDRLNGKRKSYRASSRRQRVLEDGTEQIGDLSDDDEEGEDLAKKIARLRREVEEAKEEHNKQKTDSSTTTALQDDDFASLSQALDEISVLPRGIAPTKAVPTAGTLKETGQVVDTTDGATYTVTYAPDYEQSHALAKAADFDRRLHQMEKAIGVTAAAMPGLDGDRLPRAVIPTLDQLQRQLTVLSEASTSSLDSISRRVRELTKDAEQLEKSRKAAKAAQEALETVGGPTNEVDDDDQTAKINALYGTLPAIESLAPLLPPLLDRLRSLRAIHADAATASETLERIEKTQSEMATDIVQWREGVHKIEQAMKDGDDSMNANMKVIEGWVKELEARMVKLS